MGHLASFHLQQVFLESRPTRLLSDVDPIGSLHFQGIKHCRRVVTLFTLSELQCETVLLTLCYLSLALKNVSLMS